MKDKINELFEKAKELPKAQRHGLSVAFAAITAIPVLFMVLRSEPDYQFMVGAESEGVGEIIQVFEDAQIDFEVRRNGNIWVNENYMSQANMALARSGYPSYAATSYDKLLSSDSLYMSQNKEALLNRQILEENLASAISSIEGVRNAHVRLALANETSFLRVDSPSSASVVVIMEGRNELDRGQVKAIGSLVSSGVRNLPLDRVQIINQHGQLLSNFDDEDNSGRLAAERTSDHERDYERRAKRHLNALYGYQNITISSTFNINYDRVTNTTREPLGGSVILSHQAERRYDGEGGAPMGIPGATSNQPPDHADFDNAPDGVANLGSPGHEGYVNEITNYEVGSSITNTEYQVGTVEEVSVVSILDGRNIPEEQREEIIEELSEALSLLSPVPAQTNVAVIIRDFAEVEIPEEDLDFWQTPQAMTIFETVFNKGVVAFIALLAYLLASRALRNRQDDMVVNDIEEDESSSEMVDSELTYEQLVERLQSLVDEHPKHVAEAMRNIITERAEENDE